jgi:hypothetical protein
VPSLNDAVGGEQAAEQMLLRGQAGGEGFIAEPALAGFDADERFQPAEQPAVGQRCGQRRARIRFGIIIRRSLAS